MTNPSEMILIYRYKKEGFATGPARGSAPRNCGFASRWFRFLFPALRRIARFADEIIIEDVYGGQREKDHCIRIFERHNDAVRQTVPADRLLEYDVRQGWQPLCAFLEVPVPPGPFPHLNAGKRALYKLFAKTALKGFKLR